jgi:hypothetical protein
MRDKKDRHAILTESFFAVEPGNADRSKPRLRDRSAQRRPLTT